MADRILLLGAIPTTIFTGAMIGTAAASEPDQSVEYPLANFPQPEIESFSRAEALTLIAPRDPCRAGTCRATVTPLTSGPLPLASSQVSFLRPPTKESHVDRHRPAYRPPTLRELPLRRCHDHSDTGPAAS